MNPLLLRPVVFLLILLGSAAAPGQDAAVVKKIAEEVGAATIKGDFAKVIDHTYPPLVQFLGGRQKAIETAENAVKQMKEQGFSIEVFRVGPPGEFISEGGQTFVVIPTTVEMKGPALRVIGKSYLLGISPDGKSWTFADGAGLDNKDQRDKLLPKLPAKLKLPEKEKPQVIKDQ